MQPGLAGSSIAAKDWLCRLPFPQVPPLPHSAPSVPSPPTTPHTHARAPNVRCLYPNAATGGSFSVAAGRLSFLYGFKGPSMSMDTACSSALVAIHHGVIHLHSSTSRLALAAAVNLMLSEMTTAAASAAGMLTMDGRCKTLDASADGYVRSEACTTAWLAIANASHTEEVLLRATHVNQDGRSSSLTAPNGPSQQGVIRGAMQAALMHPADVKALEMHGTGELVTALRLLNHQEVCTLLKPWK